MHRILLWLRIVDVECNILLGPFKELWQHVTRVQIPLAGEGDERFSIDAIKHELTIVVAPTLLVEVGQLGRYLRIVVNHFIIARAVDLNHLLGGLVWSQVRANYLQPLER